MKTVISADGTLLAYDKTGDGPALVLVAPVTAAREDQAELAAVLARDFTVFAYDRRGRGDSSDTPPYAVEREVEDLRTVIDEAGGSAFVFGHSAGGVLGLDAAQVMPTKITKLALYEPPFIIDNSRLPTPADFPQRLNAALDAGRRGDAVELWMKNYGLPDEMIAQFRQSPMYSAMVEIVHTFPHDLAITGDTQSGSPSTLKKWADVSVPTLVMDGTTFLGSPEDHAFVRHGADELARVLPNARRVTLEGQDLAPAHDVLALALKEFFTNGH